MEQLDIILDENFYAINVGIINFIELENSKQEEAIEQYRIKKLLQENTILITYNRNKQKSLRQFLEEKCPNQLDNYQNFLQPNWKDSLDALLNASNHWAVLIEGDVFKIFPTDIILTPQEDEYSFYFVLRLKQLRLHEIDRFLDYQLRGSFGYEKTTYHRFLQLLLREHKVDFLNEDIIKTVEEWIILNQTDKLKQDKKEKNTVNRNKIICKADEQTIQRYFYQLAKQNVLPKESIDHFLKYAFAIFENEVPAIKFTPENIKKGELMKFVHHFYTLHSYSRNEAGQWIKLLLIDSFATFDSNEKTQQEIIEYIKDNWSKEPVQYSFRKV